jgi:23S rRNA pseudouridine2605 synthase
MKKKTGFEKFHKQAKVYTPTNTMLEKAKKRFEKEMKDEEERERKKLEKKKPNSWFANQVPLKQAPKASKEAIKRKTVTTTAKGIEVKLEQMPLNKYLAHCGVASRRDAVDVIISGKVKVNNVVVTAPSHKIAFKDVVTIGSKTLNPQKKLVYILLNKPKDFVTTTSDEKGRKTVMDLIGDAGNVKVHPVGRLDRNTTGVLLLTNDGDLTQILTHPKYEVKKIYSVTTDKSVEKKHVEAMLEGIELEDGLIKADALAYTDAKTKNELGIEIHSGRNRIVRRMFEHFGYQIKTLDRVFFAGLTKKNVNRGKWRFLDEKEVRTLKHFTIKKEKVTKVK